MKHSTIKKLQGFSNLLSLLIAILVLTVGYAYLKRGELPAENQIWEKLEKEPIQKDRDKRNFVMSYMNTDYVIQPMADYEIWGLIVSQNNIHAIGDIYHTSESVDIKDLCMIWGQNLDEQIYRNMKFWSEPFACFYQPKNSTAGVNFSQLHYSNNHILSDDASVRDTINKVELGDQVHLKGMLVNYFPKGASEAVRKTSLNRSDTGNGACEVFFVEEVEVLEKNNPRLNNIYHSGIKTLLWLLSIKLILFVLVPYLEFKTC